MPRVVSDAQLTRDARYLQALGLVRSFELERFEAPTPQGNRRYVLVEWPDGARSSWPPAVLTAYVQGVRDAQELARA